MPSAPSRFINLPCVLAALLMATVAVSPMYAQHGRSFRGDSTNQTLVESSIGFLIVDGVYLEPPYSIEAVDNAVRINGTEYEAGFFDLSGYPNRSRGSRSGGMRSSQMRAGNKRGNGKNRAARSNDFNVTNQARGSGPVASSQLRSMIREINTLKFDTVVVLQQNQRPMVFWPAQYGHTLLETLIASQVGAPEIKDLSLGVMLTSQQESLQQLVARFEASPEFIKRAKVQIESVNAIDRSVKDNQTARELSRRFSYPLTMFALVLVVAAVGHLLINTQLIFANVDDPETLTRVVKATVVCLVIVGLMSVIDLVWTLIANQNGTMRELNPLGSKLINNAGQLIAFKTVVTSISLGLLFWLRENPFARRAAWWCCLALTLLTARWLTFHSLFA